MLYIVRYEKKKKEKIRRRRRRRRVFNMVAWQKGGVVGEAGG